MSKMLIPTSQAFLWTQAILAERFGDQIALSEPDQGYASLSVRGLAGVIRIAADPVTFSRADSELPIAYWDGAAEGWTMPLGERLPAPGIDTLPMPLIEQNETGFTIQYDILGLVYWMLSRCEEVGRNDLDEHGRFPASSSHAYKHGYLERPIVDEWLDILRQVIRRLWPAPPLLEPQFSMCVSHDVDWPSVYGFKSPTRMLVEIAGRLLRSNQPTRALKSLACWYAARKQLHPDDPFNTFSWIMDKSEQNGLTSAFYFICGRTDPARDAAYNPEHPAIRDLMRSIHRRGHEIGLHCSYNTYRSPQAIATEAQRLKRICTEEGIEQDVWGGRMHYLRWETPTTLYGWNEAGMSYDSTLTYPDSAGFRCGTSIEYPAFDPVAGKALNLRIRPLIAMESTVMSSLYMDRGTGEEAFRKFMQLKNACRAVNGCFTLLWHNSQLEIPEKRELYARLLS
jgi:hypothetical protein